MTQPAREARREPPKTPAHLIEKNPPGGKKESLGIPTPPPDAPPNRAPRVTLPAKTIVELLKPYGSVNAGEIAGYTPDEAARLIASKIARYKGGPVPPTMAPVREDPELQAQHALQMERLRDVVRTVLANPKTVEADGRPKHSVVQTMMGVPVNPADIDLAMEQLRR